MPTGYTAWIEDGKITDAKDFLTLCLRAFGVCAEMRDDTFNKQLPESFELNSYYQNSVKSTQKSINEVIQISDEELAIKILEERSNRIEMCKSEIGKNNKNKKAYQHILNQIKSWNVSEKYIPVKKFAIEQILMSEEQLNNKWYEDELDEINKTNISLEEYRAKTLRELGNTLSYNANRLEEEIKRNEERNSYLRGFMESISEL